MWGKQRAVPSASSVRFREYLVESEGGILLVFLISGKSAHVVDEVEVYRLDTETLSWIKTQSLGDRTLFLGSNCCTSVSASRVGCRRDCVYFSNLSGADGWWVVDMEKGIVSSGADDPTMFGTECSLAGVIYPFGGGLYHFGSGELVYCF